LFSETLISLRSEYDASHWRIKKRNGMKEAIARKNEDPLFCMKVENP
jgi:hypothetical protein